MFLLVSFCALNECLACTPAHVFASLMVFHLFNCFFVVLRTNQVFELSAVVVSLLF